MTPLRAPSAPPIIDKRAALLAAALHLIARSGLHAAPTSAVAREAGVAHGTLFLYFPTKEALLNALYVELLAEQQRAAAEAIEPIREDAAEPRELLWRSWHGLARWHLDHPETTRVIQQLRGSGVLTAETRAAELRARAQGIAGFQAAIARGLIRDLPLRTFWALYAGPILALAEGAEDDGAGEITDGELRATFEGVCRGIRPPAAVEPGGRA